MLNFTVFIEKEWGIFVAKNLELWIFSQWNTYEEAIENLKEASLLYLEDEPKKEGLLSKFKNKQYSLTAITV